MKLNNQIPLHNIKDEFTINIEPISHKNTYDYNVVHRHNYYEIMFFVKGGGYQLIDFDKVPIVDNSCYLIKPRQVHLVKREEDADGFLIQFFNTSIFSEEVSSLLTLQYHSDIKVIFENDKLLINKGISFLNLIRNITKEESVFLKQKSIHLLSTLLYELEECTIKKGKFKNTNDRSLIKFTELVNLNLNTKTVNEYAEKLNITSKKLTDIVKNKYGITPLKFIHNAVLLEIKRDLMFKDTNLKEISYNYNFDSPSNFSLFVKKNTGLSPTDLQKELLKE
ncbi:AraC-type DNA-binding protein [Tenacibaculum sp. MAR_2010_89]|uniref:AraC family transcriptional regulator n=1 Tax=Tenacibaculum sp. MAR_2010_89 TaxID=1250198 RepID=UPI0008950C15|nr:helix-turn-helix transcriptional regulator [Tenacibaculum sp. MAR_2010_89]SED95761.1 AraC-type DNA-binding protein [Tenacibaculum sp. MAR_2010_89]